jgi:hypothetical protein
MLKLISILSILLSLLFNAAAHGAVTFQLNPPDGKVSGLAGSTVGWGFSLSNTENFLVVTSASFEIATNSGTFTDYISAPENFFVVGPAQAASTVWSQPFDATDLTGVGAFTIDSTVAPGSVAYGNIVLTYDLFSLSPLNSLFNPDTDTLSIGNILTANASVAAVVPLPAAVWLFGSAMFGLVGIGKRKKTIAT